MPAAGIEPGQKALFPFVPLYSLLSLASSGYSSFDFISVSLLRSVACALAWLCLALPSCSSFWLSLYFGQLFRTAFAAAEAAAAA